MITQLNNSKKSLESGFTTNEISKISEIYRDKINISIWNRKLSRSLSASSKHVVNEKPNLEFSEVLKPKDVKHSLKSIIGSSNEVLPFFDDIYYLVFTFCKLFDQKKIWLRLDVIDHPMCPRFHTDKLKCRLVTTYVGPATQWIPHHLVNRSKLGYGNEGKSDSESGLFLNKNDIKQLGTGHVAFLKGESWQGNDGAGIVHRSPCEDSSYQRLYMTIDLLETYKNIYRNLK